MPINGIAVYNINFFGGFIVSFAVYWLLCKIWNIPATRNTWMEVDEDVIGKNERPVFGVDVSDEEQRYSPTTEFPKKERLHGRNFGLDDEASSAETYELRGLLATEHG